MNDVIHIYCDESCHLEHDQQKAMVLGAVWCPASHRAVLGREVKAVRERFGLPPTFEIKWTKVSRRVLGGPERLKPHGTSAAGLRMLLPRLVDEASGKFEILTAIGSSLKTTQYSCLSRWTLPRGGG